LSTSVCLCLCLSMSLSGCLCLYLCLSLFLSRPREGLCCLRLSVSVSVSFSLTLSRSHSFSAVLGEEALHQKVDSNSKVDIRFQSSSGRRPFISHDSGRTCAYRGTSPIRKRVQGYLAHKKTLTGVPRPYENARPPGTTKGAQT
jgi:hypothetical protein